MGYRVHIRPESVRLGFKAFLVKGIGPCRIMARGITLNTIPPGGSHVFYKVQEVLSKGVFVDITNGQTVMVNFKTELIEL